MHGVKIELNKIIVYHELFLLKLVDEILPKHVDYLSTF